MVTEPTLHSPAPPNTELERPRTHRGVLVWQWAPPVMMLSSAPVGGGLAQPQWLANVEVAHDYNRIDLAEHAAEIAGELGLTGAGAALFTAAEVSRYQRGTCDGVTAHATVGITKPTWAADATDGYTPWAPGTINIVVQLPTGLEPGAAVNAIVTITEAKTQALHEAGVPGTGTASDATVVVWPADQSSERFAGPRSVWGSRLAQATHAAVSSGIGGPS